MITEVHQQGRFYRLSTGRAAHYENLKPHVPSPEDWCIPKDMEGLEYLVVEPACEVNEKGTREKNDGNENLSLDDNEKIEVESEAGSFVEEDWNDPEQDEVPKWMEPDRPIPPGTRTGNRKRTGLRYNRYGDDFLIDKIQPDKLGEELLSAGELEAEEKWQVIDYPQEDYSTPELETDLEQSEIERRENTNLNREDARCQRREPRRTKHSTSRRIIGKLYEGRGPSFRMDGNRQAAGHSSGQFRPDHIDGDVDKYFCPGSGGRIYPHRKFDDKEAQGSERNKRFGTGRRARTYHRSDFQNEI